MSFILFMLTLFTGMIVAFVPLQPGLNFILTLVFGVLAAITGYTIREEEINDSNR